MQVEEEMNFDSAEAYERRVEARGLETKKEKHCCSRGREIKSARSSGGIQVG